VSKKYFGRLIYNANQEAMERLIESSLRTGNAFYDHKRDYWILLALKDGLPTDSTAMSSNIVDIIFHSRGSSHMFFDWNAICPSLLVI
jgi:hypothetical protein